MENFWKPLEFYISGSLIQKKASLDFGPDMQRACERGGLIERGLHRAGIPTDVF